MIGGVAAGAISYQLWKTWNKSTEAPQQENKHIDKTRFWIDLVQRLDPDTPQDPITQLQKHRLSTNTRTCPLDPNCNEEEDKCELIDIVLNPLDAPPTDEPRYSKKKILTQDDSRQDDRQVDMQD